MNQKELKNISKAIKKLLLIRDFLTRERNKASQEKQKEYNDIIDILMGDVLDLLKPTK